VARVRNLLLAIAALAAIAVAAGAGAQPAREVHGSADAYAAPGIALAWGVLRGADEAATAVVIRIVADPLPYPWLSVVGVDPLTNSRQTLLAAPPTGAAVEARVPRSRFAEVPRTEVRAFASAAAAQAGTPSLTVYFLGVPDTTPEFVDAARLDAYLAARIEGVRGGSTRKP
jgi:hypothetical protein